MIRGTRYCVYVGYVGFVTNNITTSALFLQPDHGNYSSGMKITTRFQRSSAHFWKPWVVFLHQLTYTKINQTFTAMVLRTRQTREPLHLMLPSRGVSHFLRLQAEYPRLMPHEPDYEVLLLKDGVLQLVVVA